MSIDFTNPYNFAPFTNHVERLPASLLYGHDRLARKDSFTGSLQVQIIALTRIVLVSRFDIHLREQVVTTPEGQSVIHRTFGRFPENSLGKKIIPSSTLKGAIRAMSEALGDGCVSVFDSLYRYQHYTPKEKQRVKVRVDFRDKLPESLYHQSCSIKDRKTKTISGSGLCMSCRLFGCEGSSGSQSRLQRVSDAFAGKVSISDAVLLNLDALEAKPLILKELGHPKPHHESFYLKDGKVRGRKFYFHHNEEAKNYLDEHNQPRAQNLSVAESVMQGGQFAVTIHFTNLSAQEFGLLCWAVDLDGSPIQVNTLAHKIGLGKPLGLGSVKMRIAEIQLIDPHQWYTDIGNSMIVLNRQLENFEERLLHYKSSFVADAFANKPELSQLLQFARNDIHYPDRRRWFNFIHRDTPLGDDGRLPEAPEPRPRRPFVERRESFREEEAPVGAPRTEPAPEAGVRESRGEEGRRYEPRRPPREREAAERPRRDDRSRQRFDDQKRQFQPQKTRNEEREPSRTRTTTEREAMAAPPSESSRAPSEPSRVQAPQFSSNLGGKFGALSRIQITMDNLAAKTSATKPEFELKPGVSTRGRIETIDGEKVTVKLEPQGAGFFTAPLVPLAVGDIIKVKIRRVKTEGALYEVEFSRKI